MNHKDFLEMIKLGTYDELDETNKPAFYRHLSECDECRREFETQEELKKVLELSKTPEVDDELLKEARLQLKGAFRIVADSGKLQNSRAKKAGVFNEFINSIFSSNMKLAFSSISILLVGFLLGYLIFRNPGSIEQKGTQLTNVSKVNNSFISNNNTEWISNLRFVNKDPQTGEVEFSFEATKLVHVKGNINGRKIQNLLLFAMLNEPNPGVRLNTIKAINHDQIKNSDSDIKDAIIRVAESDENPGVRMAALKSLKSFAFDNQIKKSLLFILQHDSSSALRIEAINSLMQAEKNGANFDSNDMNIFKEKVKEDNNNYVRYAAQTVLERSK